MNALMMISALLMLFGVAVNGQAVAITSMPSCLPLKTTVVAIRARAWGSHYCTNSTRGVHLRARLLSEVEQGPVDQRCRLYAARFLECTPMGNTQANTGTLMMITATMTCNSGCVRHNSTLQSLSVSKDDLIYLRTASQQRLSVNLNIGGVDVLMQFFDGRQSIVSSCETNSTSSATKRLLLCDCPLQCDKCGNGYYLPPMSSRCQPCPQGTWRKAGLDYSSCVQCPPTTNTSSFGASVPTDCIAPVCPEGKLFSECGPACRPTCTNHTPPEGCPSDCVPGCFCPPTMVEQSGECVMSSNCADFGPPPPRPPVIVATKITSGEVAVTIGYDLRVYEGVNITIDCSPLVEEHPGGSIHWYTQIINPRAIIRNSAPEVPLPISPVELVVPSTSIPNFLQMSFRCEVCTTQCWSNNSIISVVKIPPPPPPSLPLPVFPPPRCPPGRIFKQCGKACPPSCKGVTKGCLDMCVVGCFCSNELYDDDGKCVLRENCSQSNTPLKSIQPQFCQLQQDPGPCSDGTEMFAYNPITGGCNKFTYGGCLGNDNKFSTEKACLDMCSV